MSTQTKTWKSTSHQNLYRHKSGTYYVRISFGSKPSWRSLRTKVKQVAIAKMREVLEDAHKAEEVRTDCDRFSANATVGALISVNLDRVDNDPSIKPATRHYWNQIYTALRKSWPSLADQSAKSVKSAECEQWARRYSRQVSPTRYNNTLSALRRLFDMAIDQGLRHSNPTKSLKRIRPAQKDLTSRLPSKKLFHDWVTEIRNGNGRFSRHCADFVQFLAYTGLRTGEAKHVKWKHCDFERGELIVEGDPDTGTKNRETRRVPIIDPLKELLTSIKGQRQQTAADDPVCLVNEAQKAMDRAGEIVGMARITHHDLRHLFATTCIESGVDIPTVAKWLGHKDGGALAMRVYGHLRNEHSLASAKKVSFEP